MKKGMAIFLTVILILAVCSGCEKASDDRAVGTIQNEAIYAWELNFFLDSVKTELLNQAQISDEKEISEFWKNAEIDGVSAAEVAKNKAFEQAVLFKSKVLLAKESGETITPEMQNAINKQISDTKQSLGGEKAFKEALKNIGITESNYAELMKNTFLVNNYCQTLVNNGTIAISDEELATTYNENVKDYRTSVTAKHILFSIVDENKNPKSQEEQEKAKETAESVYTQIISGALNFDQAMATYSEDPGLNQNPDGYTFSRGEMVKPFEDTAFSLDEGEISKPVLSDFGWHIIQLIHADVPLFDDMKNEIFSDMASERFDQYVKDNSKNFAVTKNEDVLNTISF